MLRRRFLATFMLAGAVAIGACIEAYDGGGGGGANSAEGGASRDDGATADLDGGLDGARGSDADRGEIDASDYRAVVLADGPVAYFRLGETSGSVAASEISSPPSSATYSSALLGQAGAIATSADPAAGFDGNGYVVVPSTADNPLDFPGRQPFSLEAWVRASLVDGNYRHIFNKESASGAREQFGMFVHRDAGLGFERHVGGTGLKATTAPIAVGAYRHVVGTYDGSTLRLYLDGALVDQRPDGRDQIAKNQPLFIASLSSSYGRWQGQIDEVAIYARALDAQQIENHYRVGSRR